VDRLTPDLVLYAYRHGLFPMADPDEGDRVYWYAPDPRAVLPLERFHVSRSLARVVRQGRYRVTTDAAFDAVIAACAAPARGREATWISGDLAAAYRALHRLGHAHSVECWDDGADGPVLAGGLYGVALAGAFFGESMFHRGRDASKVALVHLVGRLRAGGFVLLDTQLSTPHLVRFGVVEIPRAAYERRLSVALHTEADWHALDRQGVTSG
jgi:leucyl/phenylalanyl-tRNA--protein transferase